jgi:osmotically-inducible protein OsmY
MLIRSSKTALAAAIALAIATSGGAVAGEMPGQDVTDVRQEAQIWTTFALSPYLRANDLKVVVHTGKATLTGNVEESAEKDLAKQIALGVDGIKEVDNQIVVQPDYVAPKVSSARSFGTAIDDASITAVVKSKLLWSKHTDGLAMDVDTDAGKVTLQGSAASVAARDLAARLAMNTRGVVSVDNQLLVKTPVPIVGDAAMKSAQQAQRDVADSWITTKVKSTLVYSTNVDSSDIAVSTSKGVVTLSGKVDSGAERALAIELAQNVRGVRSVHSKALTLL